MQQGIDYEKDGGGLLIAAWIFAVLGGLLGIIFAMSILRSTVTLEDGSIKQKYNDKARNSAKIALIVAIVMFILGYVLQAMA